MRQGGYGRVMWVNENGFPCRRMLTAVEREEILTQYIRRRSGRRFTVPVMAEMLGVCDRTIQSHLRRLEDGGIIKRTASFDASGKQNGNLIMYTGSTKRLTGEELTVERIMGYGGEKYMDD